MDRRDDLLHRRQGSPAQQPLGSLVLDLPEQFATELHPLGGLVHRIGKMNRYILTEYCTDHVTQTYTFAAGLGVMVLESVCLAAFVISLRGMNILGKYNRASSA